MPGLFVWMARLVKASLLALLLIGGLLIGLLIAIKVLLVFLLLRLWRRTHPAAVRDGGTGQVFDAEFTVVPTPPGRASVLVPERGPAALPAPER
ncbi:MAG: hypothetical protein AB7V26_13760 [Lysobacterales bacterium]